MPLIEPRWTGNAFDRTEVLLLGGFWMLVGVRRNVEGCRKEGLLIRARVTSYSYSAKLEVGILSFHSLFLGGFEPRGGSL